MNNYIRICYLCDVYLQLISSLPSMGLTHSSVRRSKRTGHSNHALRTRAPVAVDIPPMPKHWDIRFDSIPRILRPIFVYIFKQLCVIAIGRSGLKRMWIVGNSGERAWHESTGRLYDRLGTVVVNSGGFVIFRSYYTYTKPAPSSRTDLCACQSNSERRLNF